MNKKARSRKFTAKQSARLGAYFAAGVGASMTGTSDADAVIVAIDITPISGPNAGLADNSYTTFSVLGKNFLVMNNLGPPWAEYSQRFGFFPGSDVFVANNGIASPLNFSAGASIGSGGGGYTWGYSPGSYFRVYGQAPYGQFFGLYQSPDFGPNSYLGFAIRTDMFQNDWRYGYFEVTWSQATSTFEILSGAYQSEVNTPIAAGAGPGPEPVPEPGTWAAAALLAGGAAFVRWRKRKTA